MIKNKIVEFQKIIIENRIKFRLIKKSDIKILNYAIKETKLKLFDIYIIRDINVKNTYDNNDRILLIKCDTKGNIKSNIKNFYTIIKKDLIKLVDTGYIEIIENN